MGNRFVGLKVTKKLKFMDLEIEIAKLSVGQVLKIQEAAKAAAVENASEDANIKLLHCVITNGVQEFAELSEGDFNDFPLDELTKLSNEILKHSGLNAGTTK